MDVIIIYRYLFLVFSLSSYVIIIHAQDDELETMKQRHQLLKEFANVRYIHHGDEIVLYNVYQQRGIISIQDAYREFGKTGFGPVTSHIKLDESSFQSALAFDFDSYRDKLYTAFKISRADGKKGRITNNDQIQLQLVHSTTSNTMFFDDSVNSVTHVCGYSFEPPENGFTVFLDGDGANDHQLQHGSEFEFGSISNDYTRVWVPDMLRSTKLLATKPTPGRQRWKIFITNRTLVHKIVNDKKQLKQTVVQRKPDSRNLNDYLTYT